MTYVESDVPTKLVRILNCPDFDKRLGLLEGFVTDVLYDYCNGMYMYVRTPLINLRWTQLAGVNTRFNTLLSKRFEERDWEYVRCAGVDVL